MQNRCERFGRRGLLRRSPARQHLVQDQAKGEDVRAVVDVLPPYLFRRHIACCSIDFAPNSGISKPFGIPAPTDRVIVIGITLRCDHTYCALGTRPATLVTHL